MNDTFSYLQQHGPLVVLIHCMINCMNRRSAVTVNIHKVTSSHWSHGQLAGQCWWMSPWIIFRCNEYSVGEFNVTFKWDAFSDRFVGACQVVDTVVLLVAALLMSATHVVRVWQDVTLVRDGLHVVLILVWRLVQCTLNVTHTDIHWVSLDVTHTDIYWVPLDVTQYFICT